MLFILLCALSDKDRNLVERIFKDNKTKFYNIAFSYLKSDASANDVVSESMVKIIKNISTISALPCHKLHAYCVTIVKNTSLDMLRRNKHTIYVEPLEIEKAVDSEYHDVLSEPDFEILLSAVSSLSESEQEIIKLRFSVELSYREIGTTLNISEENARKRMERVLSKLRKILGEEHKS